MTASMRCLALLLLLGGLLGDSNAGEDLDHIFSSDPVLLAISGKSSAYNTWLTCANKECSVSKRQPHENVYSHGRKVFHIYANGRSKANDAIRYGDEVALFYHENDKGFGVWLSCQSKRKQCGLGTCPGLPHLPHWMWNTTSCYQNRFIIANSDVPKESTMERRHPVKVGDEISLIRKTDKISGFMHALPFKGLNDYVLCDADGTAQLGETHFHSDFGKWIIQKDMISKCGDVNYDARYKVCDRCGSRPYVQPKHESWQCCAGKMPFNPAKSICCDGLLTNISSANRDAKGARCCATVGFFPDVQMCCKGEVHFLPGQDTDADDSTVQCCGNKPYLTTRASCDDNVLTPLASMKTYEEQSSDCCDEKPYRSCCKSKNIKQNDKSRCCDSGQKKGEKKQCLFQNNTYMSGERFSNPSTSLSCRTCICQDGTTVCDIVSSCPAILPHGCYFYPANGECCPVFECRDDFRENNYQLLLTRRSHVSVKTAIPELDALTISFWMKTEQDSEGTLLSYATGSQSQELVIKTHPSFRVTFQGAHSVEVSTNLNDGSWHFVCIQWKSSTGLWALFVDNPSTALRTFNLGRSSNLQKDGYLVLGRRQQSQGNLIEAGAFVGSIAHFNIWNSKIDFISRVKTDCGGSYEGNVTRWSVATIDTKHSASIINADMCTDSTTQDQIDESNRPATQQFTWEVLGDTLRSLSGTTCQQSSAYRIRSTEYSFKLKVCPSSTDGSLGNLQFIVLQGASNSPLYWPFPYPVRLSVIVNEGNDAIKHDLQSGAARRKSKAWSLVTGVCTASEGEESEVTEENSTPDSSIWQDFITVSDARNNYNSQQQLRISATIYTEKYGDWLYWNGHYYSHRNRLKRESWYEAEANCIANGEGVHLVSIHYENENNFVKSRASDEQWIGLTDTTGSSTSFTWADRSNFGGSGFTNWARGEPQQATWHGDCGAMRTTGKWVDVPCRVQKVNAETAVTTRSFTCKTPGKSLMHQAPPSLGREVTQENEAGVFSVDLTASGQTAKVTFITGLHYIAPNMKFPAIADKVRYGANMEFGKYIDLTPSQLGPLYDDDSQDGASPENDVSGVADLDGVVDRIKIPHYDDMDRVGNTRFSIEFWISPRRMPINTNDYMTLFSKSSSSSSFFNLNVKADGSIEFSVTRINEASPLNFATNIEEDCKVKPLEFQHIAVTGNVASSLKIIINGDICYTMSSAGGWEDVTRLPASSDAPLVFGEDTNSQDSSSHKRFNGQMCYIRVFDVERTQQQIQSSVNAPFTDTGSPVGSWPLRRSQEIKLIHYVISDSNGVSDLKVLEEFVPASSSFPVVAIERNGNIYLFRITAENQVVAKEYRLNRDTRKLLAVSQGHTTVMSTTTRIQRGCFTVAPVIGRDRWILISCRETTKSPPEVVFSWKVLKMNNDGEMTAAQDGRGSLRIAGIGGLDTRPSATVVDSHLLLAAGTRTNAQVLFLDLKIDRSARPKVPRDLEQVVPIPVGPNIEHTGVTYYSYLFKPVVVNGRTSSSKKFLRRVRPQSGEHSSSYRLAERVVNPSSLTASAIGNDIMPENDWFWFLFKISTLAGGSAIQSGQRVSIQTPDNNPQNEGRWNFVKCNRQNYLSAEQEGSVWDFYIFKTQTCDPSSGGYTVVKGDIGPNDCILLWPRIVQFGPNFFCQSVFAYPTPEQIQGARQLFGTWFGPWHIMVPLHPTPVRPLPQPPGSPANSLPRNVHEGNKYALLRFGETITVPSQSRVKAALLRFARTSMAPVVVSNSGSTPPVKLIFRGNGGPIPLTGAFGDTKEDKERELSIVYREGSYAQKRMTSGLFYSISYTPPSDPLLPGEFKSLARIHGLNSFEYPKPPQNFVWLVPPPFKINGICEAVSKFFVFGTDAVENTAPNSVVSLTKVLGKAVGPGSFNEGLFKPLLTVPIDVTLLHEIGQRTYKTFTDRLRTYIPQPPKPTQATTQASRDSATPTLSETDTMMWQELGDVEAALYLANISVWKTRVQRQRVQDKLNQLLQSDWMKQQMIEITSSIAPEVLRNVSLQYSAYGGLAVVIANRLRSSDFLDQVAHEDLQSLTFAVQSHLPVLDALRPDLGISARKDIISTIMARSIVNQPWDVLKGSTDKAKQIRQAFDSLLGRNVPEELSQQIKETLGILFKTLFGPLTSTQLGIIDQVLNIEKQGALEVHSERVKDLRDRFLGAFKTEYAERIATLGDLADLTEQVNAPGLSAADWQRLERRRMGLLVERETLLRKFQGEVIARTQPGELQLKPASRSSIKAWLTENPKNFARLSNTFNTIGTIAAIGSFITEIANPDSGLRKGEAGAIISAAATIIGAIGSFHGTVTGVIDLGKLLKQKVFPERSGAAAAEEIEMQGLNRVANEAFEARVAESYALDLASTGRATSRFSKFFAGIAPKLTKFFLVLGVVADIGNVVVSIMSLIQDVKCNVGPWKIIDDAGALVTAAAGAVVGVLAIAGIETGPAGIFVFLFGLIFMVSEAIRAKKEAERKLKEARCNAWKTWCNWSKALFVEYNFLINPTDDPCVDSNCPAKRGLLRALCFRGHISKAHREALKDGMEPGKAISFGITEQKTCPAWLRHFYKRQGSHKNRKEKSRKQAIRSAKRDL